MAAIIEIKGLTKAFKKRLAVDHLDLSVEAGEIFGFVGPNGAGKTSTIRVMTTLLQPDEGDIFISGYSVRKQPREVRRKIGYMPDFFGVYHDMSVGEYLDFFSACYEIPANQRDGLISDLLELVDLTHRKDDIVDSLSRGMKQRLSLARTLVHDPDVLILDEPASGLDPRARVEIRELLVELSRLGKTIFFSTHILADVAEISTQVGIIEAGKLVASGPLEQLQHLVMPYRQIEVTLLGQHPEALLFLQQAPGVIFVEAASAAASNGRQSLKIQFMGDDEGLFQLLKSLIDKGLPVISFMEENRDLEQVFLKATKGLVT